jgi:hypothetical protein
MINRSTVIKLSEELSEHKIVWGIGGSCLLQIYNLNKDPVDLDLWAQPSSMQRIKELFKDYEKIKSDIPLPDEYHYKIKYHDIEVDFVSCFMYKPNQYHQELFIRPDHIKMVAIENGIEVPCTYLEDWFIIYSFLKRYDKADLIRSYFIENKIPFSEKVMRETLSNESNKISRKTFKRVSDIIWSAVPISISDEAVLEKSAHD